jgi:hypothetical protein
MWKTAGTTAELHEKLIGNAVEEVSDPAAPFAF